MSVAGNIDLDYWEDFFTEKKDQEYDWYCTYSAMAKILRRHVKKGSNVLVMGCGNSPFSADLYDNVPDIHITNIDFSPICIRSMLMKHLRARPGMKWLVQDCTKMPKIANKSMDVVLDKGCAYSMMRDRGVSVRKMLRQVRRVLKTGGILSMVTLLTQDLLMILLSSKEAIYKGQGYIKFELLKPTFNEKREPIQPFHITMTYEAPECAESEMEGQVMEVEDISEHQEEQKIVIAFERGDGRGVNAGIVEAAYLFLLEEKERREKACKVES
ncbi:hypothetical protein SARC_00135 [Sphaeroforma arctica JP610]|uniref:Methyltransferase domain-containing protein n=1 Tax=Sphaeroforma arctica JP610 TaxID=667725 RepID=A0A0L0GHE5_9EUKA|nr:hypothetical protein SARC_00135 [Sphaeroforma arctica JP610]KNC87763.1 hypothetical protein SARC_00135 [Sphaeroforma arctica JP610]|eukprot:XP_014161665.1 hypothetical protein SARC_00135 [Sphaeroforma arctica JP610]